MTMLGAFDVSQKAISLLPAPELTRVLGLLLAAEAFRVAPMAQVFVSTDLDVPDGGMDGYSSEHSGDDTYLPSGETCWQVKTGGASSPSRLKQEFFGDSEKELAAGVLLRDGCYVLVANDARNRRMVEERLEVVVDWAEELLKSRDKAKTRVRVYGAEELQSWISRHPRVALELLKLSEEICSLDQWLTRGSHDHNYVVLEDQSASLRGVRSQIQPGSSPFIHVHIEGPPGVGKTRFAMEVIDGAPWRENALCIFDASSPAAARTGRSA